MANFLNSIGQGLRVVGSTTSNENFRAFNRQNEFSKIRGNQNKQMVLGLLARGVENGAPGAEEAMARFVQNNPEFAGAGNVGQSAQIQKMRLEEERLIERQKRLASVQQRQQQIRGGSAPTTALVSNVDPDILNMQKTSALINENENPYPLEAPLTPEEQVMADNRDFSTGINEGRTGPPNVALDDLEATEKPVISSDELRQRAAATRANAGQLPDDASSMRKSLLAEAKQYEDEANRMEKFMAGSIHTAPDGSLVRITDDGDKEVIIPKDKAKFYKAHMDRIDFTDVTKESYKAYEKSVLEGDPRRSLLRKDKEALALKGGVQGPDQRWFIDNYREDSKPFHDAYSIMTGINATIKSGSPIDWLATVKQLQSVIEAYERSNTATIQEVTRLEGAGGIATRLKGYVTSWAKGIPSPQQQQDIKKLIGVLNFVNTDRLKKINDSYRRGAPAMKLNPRSVVMEHQELSEESTDMLDALPKGAAKNMTAEDFANKVLGF